MYHWLGIGMFSTFWLGYSIGKFAEAQRWRNNADQIWRIESSGSLFKVYHSRDDHRLQNYNGL